MKLESLKTTVTDIFPAFGKEKKKELEKKMAEQSGSGKKWN